MSDYLKELAQLLADVPRAPIDGLVSFIVAAHERGGTVYVCGNGGSAATSSHIACDLQKWAGVRAIALTDNVPLLTAWANDDDYSMVFAQQLRLARSFDVLLCLSCSGTSLNVVRAAQAMRAIGGAVLALTGQGGGDLKPLAHAYVCVPSEFYPQIEDCHSAIGHALAVALKERL